MKKSALIRSDFFQSRLVRCAEPLEDRIAPAVDILAIGGTTIGGFTDGDGDIVTIRITGSAGSVDLGDLGDGDGNIEDGEVISSIAITGASADFAITISVDSSNTSDGIVPLGAVTSTKPILGLYTAADRTVGVPVSNFVLGSFSGPGLTKNGSINVSNVSGDSTGLALQLGALAADTAINISGNVGGTFDIAKPIAGALNISGAVTSTTWTVGGVAATGSIAVGGAIGTAVTFEGAIAGVVQVGGPASGIWKAPSVQKSGSLSALSWSDLQIAGALSGSISSKGIAGADAITLGSIASSGRLTSAGGLALDITKTIPSGAEIRAGGTLAATLGGSTFGHLTVDGNIAISTAKGVIGGKIEGNSLAITAKSIAGLTAQLDDGMSATLTGGISRSTIQAGDQTISLDVGGSVSDTTFLGEGVSATIDGSLLRSVLQGSEDNHSLNVSGSIVSSYLLSGSENIDLTVGGNITKSIFSATEDSVSAAVTGSVTGSRFDSGGNVSLTIGGAVSDAVIDSDDVLFLTVTGAASKIRGVSGADVQFTAGKGLSASQLQAKDDLNIDVTGVIKQSRLTSANSNTSDLADSVVAATVAIQSTEVNVDTGLGLTTKDFIKSRAIALGSPVGGSPLGNLSISASITGNTAGSTLVAENGDIFATIGGTASALTASASGFTSLNVTGDLLNSKVFADEGSGNVIVNTGGKIVNAIVMSGSEDVSVTAGGDVLKSTFHATESSVSLTVGGNLVSSRLVGSGSNVSASVAGNTTGSSIFSSSNTILTVGGDLSKSTATAGAGITTNITGDATDVLFTADAASNITIGGDFDGEAKATGGLLTISVTGAAKTGSRIESVAGLLGTFGQFDGALVAGTLDFNVVAGVGKLARIQATAVGDQNANDVAFSVGGDFAGRLDVSGNFDSGIGASVTLIGGDVVKGAVLNFGGLFGGAGSADQFVFGGAMLGSLSINSDLETDLSFAGDVNRIVIRGVVRDTILIAGKAAFISTGSLFGETDANDGNFLDGSGAIVGNLDTTSGHGTVVTTI